MDKIPAIGDDSFTLYLEAYKGLLYIHCDVHKWAKSTKKKMEVALDYLLEKYQQPIYAPHTDNDSKQRKFLDMYEFKYFGKVKDFDGDSRIVYVKRGKR
tara:strand:+ start:494 stop:790 length:297 start_codon:yes stop_codon:yes gene_type:complete